MVGYATMNRLLFELSVLWKSTIDLLNHKVQMPLKYRYINIQAEAESQSRIISWKYMENL